MFATNKKIDLHAVLATVDGTPTVLMLDAGIDTVRMCRELAQHMGAQVVATGAPSARCKGRIESIHSLIERHLRGRA